MKNTEIKRSKVQISFNYSQGTQSIDAMKAFKRRFSANINILSFIRGNEIAEDETPFEPFTHIIEG
ncbi:MAG: hypothetical protein PHT07_22025 [Paludibacter sp.]|nr:hypothetical protein [Paludibacter sp.]